MLKRVQYDNFLRPKTWKVKIADYFFDSKELEGENRSLFLRPKTWKVKIADYFLIPKSWRAKIAIYFCVQRVGEQKSQSIF